MFNIIEGYNEENANKTLGFIMDLECYNGEFNGMELALILYFSFYIGMTKRNVTKLKIRDVINKDGVVKICIRLKEYISPGNYRQYEYYVPEELRTQIEIFIKDSGLLDNLNNILDRNLFLRYYDGKRIDLDLKEVNAPGKYLFIRDMGILNRYYEQLRIAMDDISSVYRTSKRNIKNIIRGLKIPSGCRSNKI